MSTKMEARIAISRLVDAIVDDIAEMTTDALRLEMEEDGVDGEALAAYYRALYASKTKEIGQNRLAEAKRRLADKNVMPIRSVSRLQGTDRRKVLDKIMRDNEDGQMTMAARSATGGIDPDLDSAIEDWEELGGYDEQDKD